MKSLVCSVLLALYSSGLAFASGPNTTTLDCEYQVMGRYSASAKDFDLKLDAPMTFTDQKLFNFVDATGTVSKAPYKVVFQALHMEGGKLNVSFGVYENVKLAGDGFTGKPLVVTTGSFDDTQKAIQLTGMAPDDVMTTLNCQVR